MTYDTNNVLYEFNEVNADISAVTNRNTFTDNAAGSFNLTIKKTNTTPMIGQWLTFNGLFCCSGIFLTIRSRFFILDDRGDCATDCVHDTTVLRVALAPYRAAASLPTMPITAGNHS